MALSLRLSADNVEAAGKRVKQEPIPLPKFALCDEAQDIYWRHCQMLRERGLLSEMNREMVESLALSTHDLQRALSRGASTRYPMQERNSILAKLNRLYGDSSISEAPEGANPYAAFGFAKRARQRRHRSD